MGGVAADGAVGQRGRAVAFSRPPPLSVIGELPLTVQLVSVVVPLMPKDLQAAAFAAPKLPLTRSWSAWSCPPIGFQAAAVRSAELPLTVQLVSVVVPSSWPGRRHRWAELPLTVQLVSVVAPPELSRPPP